MYILHYFAIIVVLVMRSVCLGYLRNVKTDEHFKFISVHATRSSYIAAAFVMVLFVSILGTGQ